MRIKLLKKLRKRFIWLYTQPDKDSPFGMWYLFDKKRIDEIKMQGHSGNIQCLIERMCSRMFIPYKSLDKRKIPGQKRALLRKYTQSKYI